MKILITGAAGSIGGGLVKRLVKTKSNIIALDNDEYGLYRLKLANSKTRNLEPVLDDIRDIEELDNTFFVYKPHIVLHLAAIKRIEVSAKNPLDTIKTNVMGTSNLIACSLRHQVKKFLLTSSDKAVPVGDIISLYGSTKFLQEQLVLNAQKRSEHTMFSVARFGNVMDSKGTVFETWDEQRARGEPLTLTDPKMKRFFWKIEEAVDFIIACYKAMRGGEIFVPKMKEFSLTYFIGKTDKIKLVGPREGEVLEQKLMTEVESRKTIDLGWGWVIK